MTEGQHEEHLNRLTKLDAATRAERAERAAYVDSQWDSSFGPHEGGDVAYFGGRIPFIQLNELQWCFINGQFMACALLAQAVIEHMLAHWFVELDGRSNLANEGLATLSKLALSEGQLRHEDFQQIDDLRSLRNFLTHRKDASHLKDLFTRAAQQNRPISSLTQDDAKRAIQTVLHTLSIDMFRFPHPRFEK